VAGTGEQTLRPADVTVVDMTAMWAGPLCTRLLADWGASVVTVEPAVRPDGVRQSPAQFAVLDQGKRRVPWDLRLGPDRAAFESAVAAADVLVESFSARVLSSLGYPPEALHRLNPRLRVVAIRAFPSSTPEASWVAYGRGVHAASGLGMVAGQAAPALVAYPDPLAGLAAFGTVLAALGGPGGTVDEVSLAGAISPLLATWGRPLGAVDAGAIASLRPPGPVLVR
jgi:crotonobetainyl-CoA:carnitine CoA-transferase CaiB-like acyl-CoA transferase